MNTRGKHEVNNTGKQLKQVRTKPNKKDERRASMPQDEWKTDVA
jgi:hypothetical protein